MAEAGSLGNWEFLTTWLLLLPLEDQGSRWSFTRSPDDKETLQTLNPEQRTLKPEP